MAARQSRQVKNSKIMIFLKIKPERGRGRREKGKQGEFRPFGAVLEGAVYRSLQKSYRSLHLDLTNPDFVV